MPLSLENHILTYGKEVRRNELENLFEIHFEGYRLFPMNQTIEIKRDRDAMQIGQGKVVELMWKNGKTICKYKLHSLFNVN